ncbi:MAG: hypothetical protein P8186_22935 [Anaerolineae bacterium]|jgi:hypothetical protein
MGLLGSGLLTAILCLVGLLALGVLIGLGILLLKLGVIGSYWLKREGPDDEADDYRLDQSHGA